MIMKVQENGRRMAPAYIKDRGRRIFIRRTVKNSEKQGENIWVRQAGGTDGMEQPKRWQEKMLLEIKVQEKAARGKMVQGGRTAA